MYIKRKKIRFRQWQDHEDEKNSENFPLAFVITIHEKFDQFRRLLRAIYSPDNFFCIHVDGKSSDHFKAQTQVPF